MKKEKQLNLARHDLPAAVCYVCGEEAPAAERCTNGYCRRCHAEHCTPGGATYPGHGIRVYAVIGPTNNRVIVQAGTVGFFDVEPEVWEALRKTQTGAQTSAALAGSLFGWRCPGARKENYTEDGAAISLRGVRR